MIVGAGVAAAAVGVIAGYVAYRRRAAAQAAEALGIASPAKLRSIYSADIAVLASATGRSPSLSPVGRRSFARMPSGPARGLPEVAAAGGGAGSSTTSDSTRQAQVGAGRELKRLHQVWEGAEPACGAPHAPYGSSS